MKYKCSKCGREQDEIFCCQPGCHGVLLERSPQAMSASSGGLAAPSGNPTLAASPLAAPESDSAARRIDVVIRVELRDGERGFPNHYADWAANIIRGQQSVMQVMGAIGFEVSPPTPAPQRAGERGAAND